MTDVVFSHHHPDHTVNAALFPEARIHDHWAIYAGDRWIDRGADGAHLGPSVRLLRTPGHTAEDISTVASTPDEVPPGPEHAAVAAGLRPGLGPGPRATPQAP